MKYKIAIVGATGVVGRTVLKILIEKNLHINKIDIYASKKSAGKKIKFGNKILTVKELSKDIFKKAYNYALFCTSDNISKQYVKKLAQNGCKVIDFSSAYRKRYPLIVPQINPQEINGNIICNPNCSTIASVMSLYNINKLFNIKRIIYSTYQAVSGAGKKALDDLKVKNEKDLKKFNFVINNNLIPYIGDLKLNLYTKEENKMIYETKKILSNKKIKITATCVRVPIKVCHSISINFKTSKNTSLSDIKNELLKTKGVVVLDTYPNYPMPNIVEGKNNVYVGRIRKDYSQKNSYNIFVVSDNLRKGAAQNAVEILEYLMEKKKYDI